MWRIVFFIVMVGCLPLCTLAAGSDVDLHRLTSECVRASNAYHPFQNDFAYKVLHTVHYTGWSGDVDHPGLAYPVAMVIRWAGRDKRGYYWFLRAPQRKMAIRATSDADGNIRLVEMDENGISGYTFKGKMEDGVIKGVWENAGGGPAFGFYVQATGD